MTANDIYTFITDPRTLLKGFLGRNVKELLFASLLFDKNAINTTFMSPVKAPGDPILTKFLKTYCDFVSSHLFIKGHIESASIQHYEAQAYENLGISSPTLKELKKKISKFEKYKSYLMLKRKRLEINQEDANALRILADEIQEKLEGFELTSADTKDVDPVDISTEFVKGSNNFILRMLKVEVMSPIRVVSYFDHVLLDMKSNHAQITNVKYVDCVKMAGGNLDNFLWADVGTILKGWDKVQNLYIKHTTKIKIKFILIDKKGYTMLVNLSEDKVDELYTVFNNHVNDPTNRILIKNKMFQGSVPIINICQ